MGRGDLPAEDVLPHHPWVTPGTRDQCRQHRRPGDAFDAVALGEGEGEQDVEDGVAAVEGELGDQYVCGVDDDAAAVDAGRAA